MLLPDTLREGETAASRQSHNEETWEPEWIDGRFSCLLRCPHCEGSIAVAGKYRVQDDRYLHPVHGEAGVYERYYKPLYFSESPAIVTIPPQTPTGVAEELRKSFQLFWSDLESCANRIRASIEQLLTDQSIRRTTDRSGPQGASRRSFLTLHKRIELFEAKNPEIAHSLMAVKWIGNAGSHSEPLTPDDVLDGYELIEYALDELYVQRSARIAVLTRAIIRRKGPRSRRRRLDP